ncbi:helix-turn-helix transcriptional regulator [Ottowia thiooxydans]|uniref:DNA-binding CsgD family transcriptional regulator n=1 Tax=Ottowia thiooxydans TaxID=219182 RepID=A0ABV2QF67_9BURK
MPASRSTRQAARHALARLHRMSSLEMGGVWLIEPMLAELAHVVRFDFGGLLYPSSDGAVAAYVQDGPLLDVVADSFEPHILQSERHVLGRSSHDLSGAVAHEYGPKLLRELIQVPLREFQRSDFFNVVARPGEGTEYLKLTLRTPQGAGVGTLFLFREATSPLFTPHDVANVARLEPHLARILQSGECDSDQSEIHGEGLLVVTPAGKPLWLSPETEALLAMAFGWRWRWRNGMGLPPALLELLRRLNTTEILEVPALELQTAQGWFSVRATRMAAADHTQSPEAVALHITRRVARGTRLLAALLALDLPQRQHELAWWLARGLSETQTAQRMGISIHTAVYHRRQLYNRLGVMDRQELLGKLGRA